MRKEKELSFADYVASTREQGERHGGALAPQDWSLSPPWELDQLLGSKPIAVVFQEPGCEDCRLFNEKTLRDPLAEELLDRFHMVQLNRWDDAPLTTPSGVETTVAKWAGEQGLAYLPTILFFDQTGAEVMRVDSQLRTFHMLSTFDYVAQERYKLAEPFQRFLGDRADRLIEQGIDVDIWRY